MLVGITDIQVLEWRIWEDRVFCLEKFYKMTRDMNVRTSRTAKSEEGSEKGIFPMIEPVELISERSHSEFIF